MTTITESVKQFNTGRNPELLKIKYKNMRSSAFVFYRGSCHLFYEAIPEKSFFYQAPKTWLCGDLHLENLGCYKADNRAIYFDINDFDEAALASCLFDVARLLTSIMLAASDTLKIDEKTAEQLCKRLLKVYAQTLEQGTARFMEEQIANGVLKTFLKDIQGRKRKDFINKRTEKINNKRKLLVKYKEISEISKDKKQQIIDTVDAWAENQPNPEFYKVLDVARRVAGTGSLGLERYQLLVKGYGKEERYLLDMKVANKSCLNSILKLKQPVYNHEAERIMQIQQRMQIFPQALLNSIEFNGQWFLLKELQPSQDKIDLTECKGDVDKINLVIDTFAAIVAWDQLRSSGRQGSATADKLISFAGLFPEWSEQVMSYSMDYAQQVQKDYAEYCTAYDAGFFND
jgi:uncharacterized protein (DUF2252 family)